MRVLCCSGPERSTAGHHEAFVPLPTPIEIFDLIRRRVAGHIPETSLADIPDSVRRAGREVDRRVGPQDLVFPPRRHLAAALEDVVHRLDRAVLVDRRAPSGADVDHGDEELPRPDVVRADDLIRETLVALQRLRVFAVHDLHASPVVRKDWGHLEFPHRRPAQGFNGLSEVRGAMVRVQVIAYTPTDFLEEPDTTIGRCRELVEKYAVTWVNVVDPDER